MSKLGGNNEKRFVFTTKKVQEVSEKLDLGYQIPRYENPWWKNQIGIRKAGLSFGMTQEEQLEYMKCKLDIHYFAENYCKIKLEDGSKGQMKLRDYQKDILDLFVNNRYNLLCASRQIGKCLIFNTLVILKDNISKKYMLISYGDFYYKELSKKRKLTLIERIKWKLMNLYTKLTEAENTFIANKIKESR